MQDSATLIYGRPDISFTYKLDIMYLRINLSKRQLKCVSTVHKTLIAYSPSSLHIDDIMCLGIIIARPVTTTVRLILTHSVVCVTELGSKLNAPQRVQT